MAVEDKKDEAFLSRWSRLKREGVPEQKEESPKPATPPVDKLTPESDFTPFMHPKVEDALRRVALKKLFNDPHFNTPDPFEPFSGDWNVGEPISEELLATLNQAKQHLFTEPKPQESEEPKEQAVKPDEPGKQDA
jgi:uncharacterized protein DUF3306